LNLSESIITNWNSLIDLNLQQFQHPLILFLINGKLKLHIGSKGLFYEKKKKLKTHSILGLGLGLWLVLALALTLTQKT
jgi:hypothetical protein